MSGLEITRFIEHVVGGQQHFSLFEEHLAVANKAAEFATGLPVSPELCPRSRPGWAAGLLRETAQFRAGCARANVDVRSDPAADSRRDIVRRKRRVRLRRPAAAMRQLEDARRITFEIADGGIELGERYFHGGVASIRAAACVATDHEGTVFADASNAALQAALRRKRKNKDSRNRSISGAPYERRAQVPTRLAKRLINESIANR